MPAHTKLNVEIGNEPRGSSLVFGLYIKYLLNFALYQILKEFEVMYVMMLCLEASCCLDKLSCISRASSGYPSSMEGFSM